MIFKTASQHTLVHDSRQAQSASWILLFIIIDIFSPASSDLYKPPQTISAAVVTAPSTSTTSPSTTPVVVSQPTPPQPTPPTGPADDGPPENGPPRRKRHHPSLNKVLERCARRRQQKGKVEACPCHHTFYSEGDFPRSKLGDSARRLLARTTSAPLVVEKRAAFSDQDCHPQRGHLILHIWPSSARALNRCRFRTVWRVDDDDDDDFPEDFPRLLGFFLDTWLPEATLPKIRAQLTGPGPSPHDLETGVYELLRDLYDGGAFT